METEKPKRMVKGMARATARATEITEETGTEMGMATATNLNPACFTKRETTWVVSLFVDFDGAIKYCLLELIKIHVRFPFFDRDDWQPRHRDHKGTKTPSHKVIFFESL
jgi:hypothetical protein